MRTLQFANCCGGTIIEGFYGRKPTIIREIIRLRRDNKLEAMIVAILVKEQKGGIDALIELGFTKSRKWVLNNNSGVFIGVFYGSRKAIEKYETLRKEKAERIKEERSVIRKERTTEKLITFKI